MSGGPAKLRALLKGGGFIAAPGALEPFTARIIESIGFPAVYLGGNAMGLHLACGQPMVTMTETVDSARRVLAAIETPLIVDAGAGFGEPSHTRRAVRELERAGIAAIHIDDQPYPKRAHYHIGKGTIESVGDVVDKLKVALAARRDPDFMIIARTDTLRVTKSLDETAARCKAYVEAGVDALMVLDLPPEQTPVIQAAVPNTPLAWFVSPSIQPPPTKVLQAAGFRMALYPFNTIAAVTDAVTSTWTTLRDEGEIRQPNEMLARMRNSVQHLIGMDAHYDIEKATAERRDAESRKR